MKSATAVLVVTAFASDATTTANPIRKVVTMLQQMQERVEAEAAKEKELYDKYMCYCKNSGGDLGHNIAEAETKAPQVASGIEEAISQLAQAKADTKQHQSDRAAAKAAVAEAASLREKENVAFVKVSTDLKTNVDAINKAVAALNKGLSGAFLQSKAASVLRNLLVSSSKIMDADRQDLTSFLSSTENSPGTGQVVGILKEMGESMSADLSATEKAEKNAVEAYTGLVAAKKKEIDALTKMIEEKLSRTGNLAVKIQQMKNDLSDTEASLADNKKILADLDKNCGDKESLFTENVKLRTQELAALAETIKLLNDDDALELFKKTLPASGASFLQMQAGKQVRSRALDLVDRMRASVHSPQLDFIALSLRGQKIGFEKVITMVDNMVVSLKKEQVDDDSKLEYCGVSLDKADDSRKAVAKSVDDGETLIADLESNVAATKSEIKTVEDEIKSLDKAVATATEQRKEEHQEYSALMASNAAAKELLAFAKNRLHKFYNPKLYKAPTAEAMAQIPAAPESFNAYAKKSESNNGVVALLNTLIADLDKDMTEAETSEKDSQLDYEAMMKDSSEKRAKDSRSLTDKEGSVADLKTDLSNAQTNLKSDQSELLATGKYISSLHAECDWLLKYFDVRKEARSSEIESLGRAKAVLSGADFSLVQIHSKALRR